MIRRTLARFLPSGAAAVVALLLLTPWIAAQTPDSPSMSRLLAQAKTESAQLATEADHMTSYTRTADAWESHSSQITVIKNHINQLGKTLQEMQDERAHASAWQQDAVDHIVPLAKELASSLEDTIAHLNQNKSRLGTAAYRDYLRANSEMANDIAGLIKDYHAYGEHKAAYERLGKKLETPGN